MVLVIMELGDLGVFKFFYLNCYIKSVYEVFFMCRVFFFIRRMRRGGIYSVYFRLYILRVWRRELRYRSLGRENGGGVDGRLTWGVGSFELGWR